MIYTRLFFISFIIISSLQAMTPTVPKGATLQDFISGKKIASTRDISIGVAFTYTDGSSILHYEEGPQRTVYKSIFTSPDGKIFEFDKEGKLVRKTITNKERMQFAIDERDYKMVSALLSIHPETLRITLAPDQPLLIYAVRKALEPSLDEDQFIDSIEVIKRLLAAGADPSVTYKGRSAIQLAAQKPSLLQGFLQLGAALAAKPLFRAIERADLSKVQKLLAENPNRVNALNEMNEFPLYVALRSASFLLRDGDITALSPRFTNLIFITQLLITQYRSPFDPKSIKLLRSNPQLLNLLSPEVRQRIQEAP